MKAVITLDDELPVKVETISEGVTQTSYFTLLDFTRLVNTSFQLEGIEMEEKETTVPVIVSPSLPPGTVKYSKLSDDTDLIFLNFPAASFDIKYHATKFKQVPFPNLVFCLAVKKNTIVKSHVMTYKANVLRDTTPLFNFPYANVFSGGSLCYYTNEVVKDLAQLQSFPYNWMREPFNDHLYSMGKTNNLQMPLRQVFEESAGKSFDYDILVDANKTFEQWASKLI